MLPPFAVQLLPHDPQWAEQAHREAVRILKAAGSSIGEIHHIGSTAIPGIVAKPILDLMGVDPILKRSKARGQSSRRSATPGEYGLEGRRFCPLTDAASGLRKMHLHCYAKGDPSIRRHLAFRDYLPAQPAEAQAYERMKRERAAKHSGNSHDYTDCKDHWIKRAQIFPTLVKRFRLAPHASGRSIAWTCQGSGPRSRH